MPPWKKTLLTATLSAMLSHATAAVAAEVDIPVLVPVTGFLALEGTSQRNGAVLAIRHAAEGLQVHAEVIDTGTSPEGAVTALERASGRGKPLAVAASMLGTQMLAMLPLADEYGIPLVTVSGTASITERGNPWVFRFFPGDGVTKTAHARYVVEELGKRRPAVIYQTTAYGQSGQAHLRDAFAKLGVEPVFEEGVDPGIRDMLPVLTKAMAAKPDVLVLHLHSGPTALFVRQAAASRRRNPDRRRLRDAPALDRRLAGTGRVERRLRRNLGLPGFRRHAGAGEVHRRLPHQLQHRPRRLRARPV